jgi:hypothetical protein
MQNIKELKQQEADEDRKIEEAHLLQGKLEVKL